jgi:hypothetical protein
MKKLIFSLAIAALLLTLPMAAYANNGGPSYDQLVSRGWFCFPVNGEPHCINPGIQISSNTSSIPILVFNADLKFLGTEILWNANLYAGQPCPQDEILHLPNGFVACHHYSQQH